MGSTSSVGSPWPHPAPNLLARRKVGGECLGGWVAVAFSKQNFHARHCTAVLQFLSSVSFLVLLNVCVKTSKASVIALLSESASWTQKHASLCSGIPYDYLACTWNRSSNKMSNEINNLILLLLIVSILPNWSINCNFSKSCSIMAFQA